MPEIVKTCIVILEIVETPWNSKSTFVNWRYSNLCWFISSKAILIDHHTRNSRKIHETNWKYNQLIVMPEIINKIYQNLSRFIVSINILIDHHTRKSRKNLCIDIRDYKARMALDFLNYNYIYKLNLSSLQKWPKKYHIF